jgi:hypothetical protein
MAVTEGKRGLLNIRSIVWNETLRLLGHPNWATLFIPSNSLHNVPAVAQNLTLDVARGRSRQLTSSQNLS